MIPYQYQYFVIAGCRCPCCGEGEIILTKCTTCGALLGGRSESDNIVGYWSGGRMQEISETTSPYDCPFCKQDTVTVVAARWELPEEVLAQAEARLS